MPHVRVPEAHLELVRHPVVGPETEEVEARVGEEVVPPDVDVGDRPEPVRHAGRAVEAGPELVLLVDLFGGLPVGNARDEAERHDQAEPDVARKTHVSWLGVQISHRL